MQLTVHITSEKSIKVGSYREASQAIRTQWGQAGATAFYADRQAGIIERDGKPFAHVSFNGRVWDSVDRFRLTGTEIPLEKTIEVAS
jgi:hypothetical protein